MKSNSVLCSAILKLGRCTLSIWAAKCLYSSTNRWVDQLRQWFAFSPVSLVGAPNVLYPPCFYVSWNCPIFVQQGFNTQFISLSRWSKDIFFRIFTPIISPQLAFLIVLNWVCRLLNHSSVLDWLRWQKKRPIDRRVPSAVSNKTSGGLSKRHGLYSSLTANLICSCAIQYTWWSLHIYVHPSTTCLIPLSKLQLHLSITCITPLLAASS